MTADVDSLQFRRLSMASALRLFAVSWLLTLPFTVGHILNAQQVISHVSDLVAMGNRGIRTGTRVHLRAQVTYADPEWGILFVRDATGPVFAQIDSKTKGLKPGDMLDLEGEAAPGSIAPIIAKTRFRVIGTRSLENPEKVSLATLETGSFDSRLIVTEGVLRPGAFLWDHLGYVLADGEHEVPILIPTNDGAASQFMIGAKVYVRGVVGSRADSANHPVGSQLFVASTTDIRVEEPDWKDAFSLPVVPIVKADLPEQSVRFEHPVHVRGTVIWKGTNCLVLYDGTASIYVDFPGSIDPKVGAIADVIGFPRDRANAVELAGAMVREVGPQIEAKRPIHSVTAARALADGPGNELVRLSGRLISQESDGKNYLFSLDDHGTEFQILTPESTPANQLLTVAPGSTVECHGVARIVRHRNGKPKTLQILTASPSDISVKITRSLNWKVLVGLLALSAAAAILLWIVQLRRALHAKTLQIRKQLEHEIQTESRYRRLFERNLAAVFSWKPSGEIIDCNASFARLLGYKNPAEIIGRSYYSLRISPNLSFDAASMTEGIQGTESTLRRLDGGLLHILENTLSVGTGDEQILETTALDISESRRDKIALQIARDAAQRESERDALTGLPNRRYFAKYANEVIESASAMGNAVVAFYVDLDGFKMVNDTMGHHAGDRLLKGVAERLASCVRDQDKLCRIGGDEFAAIIVTAVEDVPSTLRSAERLLTVLQPPFEIDGKSVVIAASIGVSVFPDPAKDDITLLQQADTAMYTAKRAGRNRVIVYSESLGHQIQEKNRLLSELKTAIGREEIYLHYQPILDIATKRIVRFEALARWKNVVLGDVPPSRFILVAEESGIIERLGNFILERACREAARWESQTGRSIPVAVNVSSAQLRSGRFADEVMEVLARTGLKPESLELEMTESIILDEQSRSAETLNRLRQHGVRLALDDFGTGYSSLSYLGELPFDVLKLDRSFLRKSHLGSGLAALMNALVGVAHALSMTVVVEGIESNEDFDLVLSTQADEVQGYLFGRPNSEPLAFIAAEELRFAVHPSTGPSIGIHKPRRRIQN